MRERKFEALMREYPFLIDKRFVVSHSHAVSMLDAAGGALTMAQTIAYIKRHTILTPEAWEQLEQVANRIDRKHDKWGPAVPIHERFRLHKGLAIIFAIILALVLFFGCIPTGRALAQELVHIVLEIFDGGFKITPDNVDQSPNAYHGRIEVEYIDYETFESSTDHMAFCIDSSTLKLNKLYSISDNSGLMLFSYLSTADGAWIEVQQCWDFESNMIGETSGYSEPWEIKFADGTIFYCYESEIDNTSFAIGVWNDSQVCIYAQAGLT